MSETTNEVQEAFMTDEEAVTLEKIRRAYRIMLYAITTGGVVSAISLGSFTPVILPSLISSLDISNIESVFTALLFTLLALAALVGIPMMLKRSIDHINQDLQERIKHITVHEIVKKQIENDGDREIVFENGADHDVSRETYDQLDVGMKIVISRAKYSKTILSAKRADTGEIITFARG